MYTCTSVSCACPLQSTAESSVFPEQEPALKTQVERLRKVIAALREEERSLNLSTEQKQRELEELDTRVRRLTSEEVALNTKLTRLHEREREQEEKRSDGRMEERLREVSTCTHHLYMYVWTHDISCLLPSALARGI